MVCQPQEVTVTQPTLHSGPATTSFASCLEEGASESRGGSVGTEGSGAILSAIRSLHNMVLD